MQIFKLIENSMIARSDGDATVVQYFIGAKFLIDGDYSSIEYIDGTPWTQWNGVPLSNGVNPFASDSASNTMCVVFSIYSQYD